MGLVILGIILLIIGFTINKNALPLGKYKGLMSIIGLVIIGIGFLTTAVRIIDAGHVGVQKLFGEVQDDVLYEGLNIVNPLVDVEIFSIQTQNYTMASKLDEGQKLGDDAIPVLSKDGLQVIIDLTLLYRIIDTETPNILRKIGLNYQDKVIRPQIRSQIRESAVEFDAIELYSDRRAEFENKISQGISNSLSARGFIMEELLVREINLPLSVRQSIERKITAIQEAQRMEFVLDKERKEAQRRREEAMGIADAQKIINSGLSPKLLEFEKIKVMQELVKSDNSKTIILGDSKSSILIDGK